MLRSCPTGEMWFKSPFCLFNPFASFLVGVLERSLERRTGRSYSPVGNSRMIYFIDDMNMPAVDIYGTVQPHTLIRQHLDYGHWWEEPLVHYLQSPDEKKHEKKQHFFYFYFFLFFLPPPGMTGRNWAWKKSTIRSMLPAWIQPLEASISTPDCRYLWSARFQAEIIKSWKFHSVLTLQCNLHHWLFKSFFALCAQSRVCSFQALKGFITKCWMGWLVTI